MPQAKHASPQFMSDSLLTRNMFSNDVIITSIGSCEYHDTLKLLLFSLDVWTSRAFAPPLPHLY